MKDPVEVYVPTSNRILIIPRMENSRGHVQFTFFGDLLLDLRHGSAIESVVSKSHTTCIIR